jgi:hypothetical protein
LGGHFTSRSNVLNNWANLFEHSIKIELGSGHSIAKFARITGTTA